MAHDLAFPSPGGFVSFRVGRTIQALAICYGGCGRRMVIQRADTFVLPGITGPANFPVDNVCSAAGVGHGSCS